MSFFQSLAAAFKGEAVTPRAPLGRSFISPWIAAADWRGEPSRPEFSRGPSNYAAAAREAYLRNPVAQRAVRIVAEGVGSAPVRASHPELLALVNETSAGQPLLETLAAHLMLHGNAGRPMLLEGGLRWQALALTPADMDFATLKAAAARDIALAFGVPPMLLGIPGDNTYANYREANRALWRLTLLPVAGKILSALAEGLRPWFAGASLIVDFDRVPALGEDRERLWAQVTAADFLTGEEKRALLGIEQVQA